MSTTDATQKRPRIQPAMAAKLTAMRPDDSFERATNDAIRELHDVRMMLAESIMDLESPDGRKPVGEWLKDQVDMANEQSAVSLMRILRYRLRDRGIDL